MSVIEVSEVSEENVTENDKVSNLEDIMNEIDDLMMNCNEKLNENIMGIRRIKFSNYCILDELNKIRNFIIDSVKLPLPLKPELNDNNINQLKNDHSKLYLCLTDLNLKYLTSLINYDTVQTINNTLNQIRSILGSISALHYSVVSNYIQNILTDNKKQLKQLLKSFQTFLIQHKNNKNVLMLHGNNNNNNNDENKENLFHEMISDEVSNYNIQLIQDLFLFCFFFYFFFNLFLIYF